jgi:hypothetical protein
MVKRSSALAGIFDEPEALAPEPAAEATPTRGPTRSATKRRGSNAPAPERRSSHPGKKPVLIHIPEDMHRTLRQLSVEEGGEPLTVITERLLRQYLVQRGHARFAP